MGFILLLDNNKKWTINPLDFSKCLNENFRHIELIEIMDLSRPYSFEFKIDSTVEGFIHKDGDSIHFDGNYLIIYETILILRNCIPLSERILFFDDSYNNSIEITSETTKYQIEEIFNS